MQVVDLRLLQVAALVQEVGDRPLHAGHVLVHLGQLLLPVVVLAGGGPGVSMYVCMYACVGKLK